MVTSQPSRILIVDDEPHIVMAIDFLLSERGYQTATAADGREALAKISVFNPHLVFLDVMMPRLSGFEVAQEIREDPTKSHIQLVFLTARGTRADKLEGYGSGGDVYLTKPFDNQQLVDLVEDLLG